MIPNLIRLLLIFTRYSLCFLWLYNTHSPLFRQTSSSEWFTPYPKVLQSGLASSSWPAIHLLTTLLLKTPYSVFHTRTCQYMYSA